MLVECAQQHLGQVNQKLKIKTRTQKAHTFLNSSTPVGLSRFPVSSSMLLSNWKILSWCGEAPFNGYSSRAELSEETCMWAPCSPRMKNPLKRFKNSEHHLIVRISAHLTVFHHGLILSTALNPSHLHPCFFCSLH